MFQLLRKPKWPPYVAGALIGVLSWFSFLSVQKPIGVSTAVAKTAGVAERVVAPQHVDTNSYFLQTGLKFDWEWALVVGIALGAFTSAKLSKSLTQERVPGLWRRTMGPSIGKRYLYSFAGGFLLMYGARVAGGCTSGHGISGSLQLALSGWTFFLTIFAGAVVFAWLIYGRAANAEVPRG